MKPDLVCEVVNETVRTCAYTEPTPFWVYPVVIAVFLMALAILALVARITFSSKDDNKAEGKGRRYDDYQNTVKIETDEPIKVEQVD